MRKSLKNPIKEMMVKWEAVIPEETEEQLCTVDPRGEYNVKNTRTTEDLLLDFSHRPYVSILKDEEDE